MKTYILLFMVLLAAVSAKATPPEVKPSPSSCKSNLKDWSQQKTQALTITQLTEHMDMMYACAAQSKKHEKKMQAYLDEFYRTHTELADRAFDFIMNHGLVQQFGVEENGVTTALTIYTNP
jgi:hypothetical protein